MGAKEKKIINEVMLLYSKFGGRLFRMNTGRAWTGSEVVRINKNDIILKNARPFSAGFKGLSDLIGFTRKKINVSDVGKTFAIFTAFEVKSGSLQLTQDQEKFLKFIELSGGISKKISSKNDIK